MARGIDTSAALADEVSRLYQERRTTRQVAARVGLSKSGVLLVLRRHRKALGVFLAEGVAMVQTGRPSRAHGTLACLPKEEDEGPGPGHNIPGVDGP